MSDSDPLDNPHLDQELGGLRRGEGDKVYHPDKAILINTDGEFVNPVGNAKARQASAKSTLWRRIGPLRYGNITISRRTEVWNERRDEWWRAEEVTIYEDGEPEVTFKVKNSNPRQYVRLFGSQIADLVSQNLLSSTQQVSEQTEQMLEDFRTDTEATDDD